MASYLSCSGCRWFRNSAFGLSCVATFHCKHYIDYQPSWVNGTTAPPSHSVTFTPSGYRTPEDRLQDIERRVSQFEARERMRGRNA